MARKKMAAIELPSVDSLFSSQEEREASRAERVANIPLDAIEPFPGHPFRVVDDEEMEQLADSVAACGILVPLTVRPLGANRYGLVSGHRRKRAAELAGLAEAPCVVRDMGDDEAVIAMVDSNLQREAILPSERAFAYSMRLEAMKRQGQRTDLTCAPPEHKLVGRRSRDILAEELGQSKEQIRRYIRLTFLIPDLLSLVDEGAIKLRPAVELSYLAGDQQRWVAEAIGVQACTPSHAQAIKMRRFSEEGRLSAAVVLSIMEEEKPNQVEQFKMPKARIARFFSPSATKDEIEGRIVRALELLERAERRRDGLDGGGAS
ncbi:chromosome partitioning protein ParB [Gordonibacter sp. 28C]|uniref:ParB/RepB/Spo0J family partition protein n=1 Tax=Gordonibacter sp. 28C TaxID=2078569 RepID=UPI000DF7F801|nr:ParB/RepB/Spo0J family partition protein [Gordonibacter sp. 28C]RDB58795.1 chromosome partitioning protein ParB [Gordonibacter sp. 28C]